MLALKAENISKQYRLGQVGTGTLSHDLNRFWHQIRGKEDPYLKIGDANDRSKKGSSEYVWSLQDINFEIERGDAIGIIGRNGAGKSTLLKLLSKVTKPTTGKIYTNGRIASLLEVGTGFNPEMTGRENIFLNGAILGMTRREITRKFDEIVDFSGVERYVDTPVKRYSSGMYVRLAFAVAAHLESEILIVDEVLAVGDAEFQKKCLGKMGDVSKGEGRTVLFVSHNMAAVKQLCDSGIVLEQGRIVQQGSIEDATNFYLSKNFDKSNISLEEREDKKGNGKLRVKKISYINADGIEVGDLILGEPCKIVFDYELHEPINEDELTLVMQITDNTEKLMTTFATDELGIKFSNVQKKGQFVVDIPKLSFRGGQYFLSYVFSLKKSFTSPHIMLDFLANASSFNVLSSDLYDSGVILRNGGFSENYTIYHS